MTTVATASQDGSTERPSGAAAIITQTPAGGAAPGGKRPDQPGAAELAEFEAAGALPQVLKIVGSVVAPTTLLTALLFYFGLVYAIGFYRYFGVNYTVLGLPVQDYLILSADGLIIPLIYVTSIALFGLWLYQLRLDTLSTGAQRMVRHVLMPTTTVAGSVLVGLAMANALLRIQVFPANFWEARGLSLSIGVLLLAYGARLRRMLRAHRRAQVPQRVPEAVIVAKWGGVFVLVSTGLFWAVSSYAIGVGQIHAQEIEAFLPCSADVVLHSEKSLNLQASGVREVPSQSSDAAYRFRYEGLKLVPQSGNQYLLLPAGWTPANGVAIVLPRSGAFRLEFSQPAAVRDGLC